MLSLEDMIKASQAYKAAKTAEERRAVDMRLAAQETLNDYFYPTLPQVPDFLKPFIPQP